VVAAAGVYYLTAAGHRASEPSDGLRFDADDARVLFERATQSSAYAWQAEMASGFLTLPGGHRLGLAGRAVMDGGVLSGIRHIGSFCLRLAREVRGAADSLLRRIVDPGSGRVHSTLIASPPRCGKTTVLRDAIRQLSEGSAAGATGAMQVSLVDERSEVAGCWQGVPTRDVGPHTDVMDGCLKAAGMLTMLRAMSPDILATDEIGRPEDTPALEEAARGGVTLLATAHAWDLSDLLGRPATRALLRGGHFGRVAFLSRQPSPGTVSLVLLPRELSLGA
jgi:stage III sporulation protein AA